ncbi:MAG: YjbH domain-containing protein [Planctomycetales bacterium]|nr:YjbH domain-containing protein [bacterium]UNM07304.1 MAG: YjbH domain-containing protein [Planctomycetales bacterium]
MRRVAPVLISALLAIAALVPAAASEDTQVDGVSGLLFTPTAEVVNEGRAVFTWSRHLNTTIRTNGEFFERSYAMTLGYLPNVEVGMRFADFPDLPDSNNSTNFQDRSISAKLQLFNEDGWQGAVGAIDLAGDSQTNEAMYGVLGYNGIEDLELSAGYGTDKLDGFFGGARWSPFDQASLVGEFVNDQFNYGLEVRPLKGLTLKAGRINEDDAYQGSYSFPLDPRGQELICCPVAIERCECLATEPCDIAAQVRDALVAESFENVLVGTDGDTLVIEYENRRFREQVDGLAVAALTAATHSGTGITRVVISPKLEDVPQMSFIADMDELLTFLEDPAGSCQNFLSVPYRYNMCPADTVFASEGNKRPGALDVSVRPTNSFVIASPFQPSWRTAFGLGLTEELSLARGTKLIARQNIPVTDDITEKTEPVMTNAFINWNDSWDEDFFLQAQAGMISRGNYGGVAEAGKYFDNDRFKLGVSGAYIETDDNGDPEDSMILGELAVFEPSLDFNISLQGGEFLEGDDGFRITSTRYFGPTQISFFAYDTNMSSPAGGFRIFLPIPLYDQGRHGRSRLGWADYYGFQYRTDSDPWGSVPLPGWDLDQLRERLRPAYVSEHYDEFRRAAWLYLENSYSPCEHCSHDHETEGADELAAAMPATEGQDGAVE